MARRNRRATPPSPEALEALYERRRAARGAPPPDKQEPEPGSMKTYKVCGPHIVHNKKKGDLVDLWDIGATRALVQAGHLVEVVEEEKDQAESADEIEEADNGS